MIRQISRLLACLLCTAASFVSLHASQVRPVDLEQMTQRAARIFSGRCTVSRVELDPTLRRHVVVATFRVQRAVKGVEGNTVTVRMLASPSAAVGDEAPGVPSFRPGEEVVLFLYGESALGLSSPVGLGQGRFRIFKDKHGRKVALNDFGNARLIPEPGLPDGVAEGRKHRPPAPIDPDDLLDRAARIAGGSR